MKIDSVKVKSPAIATEFYSRILVVLQFFIEDCISVIENQRPSCISAGGQRRPCKVPCRINRQSPRKLLLYWYPSLAENRTIKSLTQPLYYLKKGSIFSENGGFFFYYLGFLSQTFMNHRRAREGGGHFFNSSLPLLLVSQTLRH